MTDPNELKEKIAAALKDLEAANQALINSPFTEAAKVRFTHAGLTLDRLERELAETTHQAAG